MSLLLTLWRYEQAALQVCSRFVNRCRRLVYTDLLAAVIFKTMYVYINSEPGLWTVGFYSPNGEWHPDSDHADRNEASERVAWLNGSRPTMPQSVQEALNSGDGVYRP